ncbi:cobalt-precorrin-5B (C(1))-methyltransferase CbiD [Dendrosporobacter sp. 1207_IL3150]|uniref:cobalt-precorrin-5B (C(1))-methyltransferase CbiD n=1 Tax=Dendrosporobacter sp. 1207_IL3150 TaxID=3084054 RepID=UPI002FDA60A8
MSKKLRSGFTTGSCAAAAAKAAVLAHYGQFPNIVEVLSPQGKLICVPIASSFKKDTGGFARVIKDSGDDPDITNGTAVEADVRITSTQEITIKAGKGVGVVTKPGLAVAVGQPAINPGPHFMITNALREVLPIDCGAEAVISIPAGETLAKRTLNSTLGIIGGLSIIGTTGIVEPMSEEAFKNSLTPQISVAKAQGYDTLVLVPGKIGQDIAINKFSLPAEAVIQTSNFIGHMLENCVNQKIKNVLLFGHLGKLVKVAAGIFHTHNRMADARLETLAAYMGAAGAPQSALQEILACTTTEAALPIIEHYKMVSVYDTLAKRASERAMRYVFGDLTVGTAIVTLKGDILGYDSSAIEIGGTLGWNIK